MAGSSENTSLNILLNTLSITRSSHVPTARSHHMSEGAKAKIRHGFRETKYEKIHSLSTACLQVLDAN